MFLKKVVHGLNIRAQCKSMAVGLWSCPQFIFLIMGIVVISTILVTYHVGQQYIDAYIVLIIVILITIFLFIISFIIIRAFEEVVKSKKLESEQAEEILKLKDQFVFIAAHELRTPSNAIKWGLGLLHSENPELVSTARVTLDIIQSANNKLLALVNDLLEVARIESGTINVNLKKISPRNILIGACKDAYELASLQNKKISFKTEKHIPEVWGDSARLKEVFMHLITNAIKYSGENNTVCVSTEMKDETVVFHITDNGVGLSSKEQGHIFEKFWRSESAHNIAGTGLGLFITKELVELMSGDIWFKSQLGEGTTFSFSLKRVNTSN